MLCEYFPSAVYTTKFFDMKSHPKFKNSSCTL